MTEFRVGRNSARSPLAKFRNEILPFAFSRYSLHCRCHLRIVCPARPTASRNWSWSNARSASSRAAFEKTGRPDWTLSPAAQDLGTFAPERWLRVDEKGAETFDGAALPQNAFGGGPRGCFGKWMTESFYLVTCLLYNVTLT